MELTQLTKIMRQNGIVGAGGAGFPSYAKLNKSADTIILNCAECEPLLKLHRQVMEKYAYEIMSALAEIAEAVEAKDIIIGIKGSYKEAVNAVKANLDSFRNMRIGLLPEIYPAGDEVVLIYETTGRVVPPGTIPISVGVTVFNVETALNVYNAIHNVGPVYTKYVTVAGEVKNPVTLKVPLGMTNAELIELAGGATIDDYALISGGPMMGRLCQPYETVTKTSSAILVLPKNNFAVVKRTASTSIDVKRAMAACCQCKMCTDLCSRNLLGHPIRPNAFMRSVSSGNSADIKPLIDTYFCSQCGICEMYACFNGLSPRTLIGAYKMQLKKAGVPMPKDVKVEPVKPERDYRLVNKERLTERLGLGPYDGPAPLVDVEIKPKKVKLAMSQHIGAPGSAVVKVGDKVKAGQIVSDVSEDKLGVPVHASIDGTVTDINDKFIKLEAK